MTCIEYQAINVLSRTHHYTRDVFAKLKLQRSTKMPTLAAVPSPVEDSRIYVVSGVGQAASAGRE